MADPSPGRRIRDVLAAATRRIGAESGSPGLDAELLMGHALGVSRDVLLLSRMDDPVPPDAAGAFEALVERRWGGEPIAYILGVRDFWTIELRVGPGVLIPRPDTETLIEAAVAHFAGTGTAPRRVIDLGTGSGALLLAALDQWPAATGLGIDRSAEALAIAQDNARRLGMADRATMRLGDWGEGVDERFDLLLCNPPYIEATAVLPRDVREHEPAGALFAGADGLDDYRALAPVIGRLIERGGIGCVEIGAGQADAVEFLFAAEGLAVTRHHDLAGHIRCLGVSSQNETH